MVFNLVTNWNFSPSPSDLQSNETFQELAEAEFAANRTGKDIHSYRVDGEALLS